VSLDFSPIFERWPMLLDGALVTMKLAASATILGFIIGTLCAIGRNSKVEWLSNLCACYVEAVRTLHSWCRSSWYSLACHRWVSP